MHGCDACHHTTFQIHRRGAGALSQAIFVGNTGHDRICTQHNVRRWAAEYLGQVCIARVALVVNDDRGGHNESTWSQRPIQPTRQPETDQTRAALLNQCLRRRLRTACSPTANRDRPAQPSRNAGLGSQSNNDTGAHYLLANGTARPDLARQKPSVEQQIIQWRSEPKRHLVRVATAQTAVPRQGQ